MSVVKRKRGRPKNNEVREISNFDLTLIQEYRKHTEFYDPNHPKYKNRPDLEYAWLTISRSMGNSVQLLKNRMIQLRNRFSLEKRRIEMLQHQYQDPTISSQWPLYEKLTFLGDHIKTRRNFVKPLPVHPKNPPLTSSDSEDDGKHSQSLPNGVGLPESITPVHHMVTRQHVLSFSNDNDVEDDDDNANTSTQLAKKRRNHEPPHQNQNAPIAQSNGLSDGITVVNGNALRRNSGGGDNCGIAGGGGYSSGNVGGTGVEKFKAFGQFLASSLMEINEKDALRLIEKFTSDLVRSLLVQVEPACNDVDSLQMSNSNLNLSI